MDAMVMFDVFDTSMLFVVLDVASLFDGFDASLFPHSIFNSVVWSLLATKNIKANENIKYA